MLRLWLLVSILAGAAAQAMNLTLVKGTRCLDGTDAGFYYRPAQTSRAANRWVIYLQGGGLCYDPAGCNSRAGTSLGSSKYWGSTHTGSSSQDADSGSNPDFWDAHQVYVPYCTGDLHTGTVAAPSLTTFGLYFSGHSNIVGIVNHLNPNATTGISPLTSAKEVLLTGDSAGGMGTFYNVDWLADALPNATVKGAPVAGWFFAGATSDQPLAQWAPPNTYPDWQQGKSGTTQALVGYLVQLYRVYIHPNCAAVERYPFHCGSVHNMYPKIKAPLFVLQNMYDNNQINSQLFMPGCSGSSCSADQLGFVAYFGQSFRKSTRQVIDNVKKGDGLFLPSCWAHTEGINVRGAVRINGYGPTELLGNWFFNRDGRTPYQLVDDCPAELPCNPSCNTLIPEPRPPSETQCATELNTLCSRDGGCFACAMENLPQLLDALCTVEELNDLCANPPAPPSPPESPPLLAAAQE
eukprot:gene11260-22373_t